ncbi:hypothetical protein A606_04325 [Corynebacterium terpenotabidum Y-11]|uniref:DUF202 domain-containing protein n=1 Tax=Corynebacterium terpenotabidum Y-11 TaxID=1200352 RepID=S4XDB9_9CORY|nr:hypothetical protein A606_04325 [Corynebacterium terpenotabidum Y-11]
MTTVVDPGLQPERTVMAWGRTSLAFMVAAGVLLRWTGYYGVAVVVIAGGLLVVALSICLTQRRRYRRAVQGVAGIRSGAAAGAVLGLSLCTVVLGLSGMVFLTIGALGGQ